jgi:hypothetical protein
VVALTEVVVVEEEAVVVISAPKVGEKIFELHAPIVEEGVFDGIADAPIVVVVEVVEERPGADQEGIEGVDRRPGAEGDAACAIDEEAVEGDTAAATHGAEEAGIVTVVAEAPPMPQFAHKMGTSRRIAQFGQKRKSPA